MWSCKMCRLYEENSSCNCLPYTSDKQITKTLVIWSKKTNLKLTEMNTPKFLSFKDFKVFMHISFSAGFMIPFAITLNY